jgi:hypothetical protein
LFTYPNVPGTSPGRFGTSTDLASAMYCRAMVLKRAAGIRLPGKGSRMNPALAGFGRVVAGS